MLHAKTLAAVVIASLGVAHAQNGLAGAATPSPSPTIDPQLQQEWTKTLHQVEDVITAFARKNQLPINDPLFPWLQTTPTPAPTTTTPVTTTPAPTTKTPSPANQGGQGGQGGQGNQQGGQTGPQGKPKCVIMVNPKDKHNIQVNCAKTDRLRFIGLGDWGEEFVAPYVLAVRDGVIKEAKTNTFDFILAVGDNFYQNGVANTTDALWRSTWLDRWQIGTNLTLPWIAFMGNHDWYGNAQSQIDYSKSQEVGAKYWIMPSKYYSVDTINPVGKKFKITVLDTMTMGAPDFEWAAKEFNDPTADFVLAAGHHQVYSAAKRGDNTTEPMLKLKSLVENTDKVKAYLCGHEHDMQFLRAANKDYFMFGGGGRTLNEAETGPGTKAEVVFFKKKYGFATFDVAISTRTVVVTYHVFDSQGNEIETPVFTRKY